MNFQEKNLKESEESDIRYGTPWGLLAAGAAISGKMDNRAGAEFDGVPTEAMQGGFTEYHEAEKARVYEALKNFKNKLPFSKTSEDKKSLVVIIIAHLGPWYMYDTLMPVSVCLYKTVNIVCVCLCVCV
eukprot:GHVO01023297.1.p2 GENE.GHVO01023297.1~~GHVO01023297.1.p2  ORF type:complete len:129 (-),score=26.96 GHVO01023297.1:469-855(-)